MPVCRECRQFIYRPLGRPRIGKYLPPEPTPVPIARCQKCDDEFDWLPPNFDGIHRFRKTTHELCEGEIWPIAKPPNKTV
jgi:hypothetical protein